MGAWGEQADAVLAGVEAQVAKAEERARAATRLRAELDQVRGEALSARREVAVTCDTSGHVVDLRFTDAAYELTPAALSHLTLATIADARRKAGDAALILARDALGEESPAVGLLARELGADPTSGNLRG